MSQNNRHLYLFLCICLLSILITGIYFGNEKKASETFFVTEYEGKIAVFRNESTVPEYFFETKPDFLPEKDREKLKDGITVNSEADLFRLMEDFSG